MRMKKGIAFSMTLCMLFVAVAIHMELPVQAYTEKSGYVTGDGVRVRKGAGTTYEIVTQLNTGHEVMIKGEATAASNGATWYYIGFYQDGNYIEGYMHSDYVRIVLSPIGPNEDAEYEKYLDMQGFPETYRTYLRALHKVHPTWTFVALPTGLEWPDVVANESKLGSNLVPSSSITSWKSLEDGAIDWTTGTWIGKDTSAWVAASTGVIQYYLDPRNFLREDSGILQFESLEYIEGEQTIEGIANILSGSFMATDEYYRLFIEAGKQNNVSPYHLASRCLQEVGTNGSNSSKAVKDADYAEFNGYYNFFNIGASPNAEHNAMYNGLTRAKSEGWDTPEKSIKGGAAIVASRYIAQGQNTLYLQKFDVVDGGNGYYWHQYMTNLQAAASEATLMKRAYGSLDGSSITYLVPIYLNMPDTPPARPTDNGSPYSVLSSLTVNGYWLNEAFDGYQTSYTVSGITQADAVAIQAAAYAPNATINGIGTVALAPGENTLVVTCNGTDGSTRSYTIQIEREAKSEPVLGDTDLDGKITAADALQILRFVAEIEVSNEQQQQLSDVNKNGVIDPGDALLVLRHVAGEISGFGE